MPRQAQLVRLPVTTITVSICVSFIQKKLHDHSVSLSTGTHNHQIATEAEIEPCHISHYVTWPSLSPQVLSCWSDGCARTTPLKRSTLVVRSSLQILERKKSEWKRMKELRIWQRYYYWNIPQESMYFITYKLGVQYDRKFKTEQQTT